MAKSRNIVLRGKAYWARVYEGNHDEFGGKEFYKITVALDSESWSKYNQSGLGLKPKAVSSDDSTPGITFRRDLHAKTGKDKNGKEWTLGGGAPRVVDADKQEFSELIGNGSVVEVLVNIYVVGAGPMKGKRGHRLEAVKVLEHIPYESMDFEDDPEFADDTPEKDDKDEAPFDTDEPEKKEEKPTKKASKGLPF